MTGMRHNILPRRRFLAVLAGALAATAGCRRRWRAQVAGQPAAEQVTAAPPTAIPGGAPPATAPAPQPTLVVAGTAAPLPGGPADLLLLNGKVLTVDTGDRTMQAVAVKDGLMAYEAAMNANPRPDPRHRIEHCVLCTPEATRRMKGLGVVVSTQPQFITVGGDRWRTVFGDARMARAIVTREWLDAGIAVALGSDAPTTPWLNPQVTLAAAMVRRAPSGQIIGPDQCLTFAEALRAHTMGSAYAGHEEAIKGSVEPGKLADLAVWAQDPSNATWQDVYRATIAMTIVGGKVVYQA